MISPQAFFESSCLIDVGTGSAKNPDLSNEPDVDSEKEAEAKAKLLFEELRKRLRSVDGGCFKMSDESKERLIDLLSNQ